MAKLLRVMMVYSHNDESFRNIFDTHLAILKRLEIIEAWHDRELLPGGAMHDDLRHEIESANIILLLVSPDFIASDYCYKIEMTRAIERHNSGDARVVPIILRPTALWTRSPIGGLTALPNDGKPISEFANLDRAFCDIVERLSEVLINTSNKDGSEQVSVTIETQHAIARVSSDLYKDYARKWEKLAMLDHWRGWTSGIYHASYGTLAKKPVENLRELRDWLFPRVWPGSQLEIEKSFKNFLIVLNDFLYVFFRYAKEEEDRFITRQFYKIDRWDKEEYDRLFKIYDKHIELLEGLTDELTRAANHVCGSIRAHIDPEFRLKQGELIVEKGPFGDLSIRSIILKYDDEGEFRFPYKGLEEFEKELREE
ncbi:toll/interleukin-1 receptor domain-containing protein [bacterium]|nr:MAG: toll/interleukin-1 receptor domain-containing protein [bacterium]